jgi:hypothetical protein
MLIENLLKESSKLTDPKYLQGEVVDASDPLAKSRVRVRIEGFNDDEAEIPLDMMSWFVVVDSPGNSTIRVPPVGTRVVCEVVDNYNVFVLGSFKSTAPG